MTKLTDDLPTLKTKELQLQSLIDVTDNKEHAQCIRLLSIYIAIYKDYFGEIPFDIYEQFLIKSEVDENMLKVFESGMHEAIATLNMVKQAKKHLKDYDKAGITLN